MKRFSGILWLLCLVSNLSLFANRPLNWYTERTSALTTAKVLEIEREILSDLGNLVILEHLLEITGLATYQDLLAMPLAEKAAFGKNVIIAMLHAKLAGGAPVPSGKPVVKPAILPPSSAFSPVASAGAGSGVVSAPVTTTGSGYAHRTKIANLSNKKAITELLTFIQATTKNVFIIEDLLNIINPVIYSYQNLIGMRLDQKYAALVSELNKIINPIASATSAIPAAPVFTIPHVPTPAGPSTSPATSASTSVSHSTTTIPVTAPLVQPSTGLGPNAQILVDKGVVAANRLTGINDSLLTPYATRAKVGTPAGAVENKMVQDGIIAAAAAPVSEPKSTVSSLPSPAAASAAMAPVLPGNPRPALDLSGIVSGAKGLKSVSTAPADTSTSAASNPTGPLSMIEQLKAAQAKRGLIPPPSTDTSIPVAGSTGPAGAGTGFNPAKAAGNATASDTATKTTWGKAGSKATTKPTGFVSSRPRISDTGVAGAGSGSGSSAKAIAAPMVDIATLSGVEKYQELLKRRTPNDKLLEYLLAPRPVTKENIEEIAQRPNDQDISNKEILDYLLEHKFNQPKATVDTMLYEHKQVDLKRRLIPFAQRKEYDFKLSHGYNRSREWIEFFSPNNHMNVVDDKIIVDKDHINRHLDYGQGNTLFLIDSNTFDGRDYNVFPKIYNNYADFYWNKDGKSFLIVYGTDGDYGKFGSAKALRTAVPAGYSQLYDWITGDPVSDPMPPVIETVEIAPEELAKAMKKALKTEIKGESKIHFAARGPAGLKFTGELTPEQIADPDYLAALAIHYIDTELPLQLTDDQVKSLKDPASFMSTIAADLEQDPSTADKFTKAKIYCAINAGAVSEDTNPDVAKWRKALKDIVANYMRKYNLTPTVGQKGINGSAFGETISKFELDTANIRELQNPDFMTRELINELTRQDHEAASKLDRAKIFYGIKAGLVDASNPDLERWKTALEVYD